MSPPNPPSTRIRKRQAPQRLLPDLQNPSVLQRRSSRIQSEQCSISIPHVLGSLYKSQSLLGQPPKDPRTSQPAGVSTYTHVPTSGPVEVSVSVPLGAQPQEYQIHSHQTQRLRSEGSVEISAERPPKRARLTKENLKTFEKMGGRRRTDLKPLRFEPTFSCSQATSKPSATTDFTSRTVPTTDPSFPHLAFENGILDASHSTAPSNLDYLQNRLDRERCTPSPTESEYQDFAYRIQRAPNEMTILVETSTLLKKYGRGYRRVYNQAFTEFPKNVGFNNMLSAAKPNLLEGLEMTEFDPISTRRELGGSAVPTRDLDPPTLSHLAGEWKEPSKDMVLAQTQAEYDGACMVYARDNARLFLNPDPAGFAFVSTFATDGTTFNTFANYSSETKSKVKYHHYLTSSSPLIGSYEDHKKSRRRLRNLEDDAKEAAEKLRDELHEKWSADQRHLSTSTVPETAKSNYDYED